MLIYPAIDIDGGRVARGPRGATGDPVREAQSYHRAGAAWLHVVDMDRVFGTGDNTELVRGVAAIAGLSIQLGGGWVQPPAIRDALEWGVSRVVVGPSLIGRELAAVASQAGHHRIAAGIDVRAGRVFARAAGRFLNETPRTLVDRSVDAGVRTVVYRDLDRDGRLDGADLDGARQLVGRGASVILAGGIASIAEIERASAAGIAGVIVGRAMHEGRFTLPEVLLCSR